jgi:hypothetical protein
MMLDQCSERAILLTQAAELEAEARVNFAKSETIPKTVCDVIAAVGRC